MSGSLGGHGFGQRLGLGEQLGYDRGGYGWISDQQHDDRSGHHDHADRSDRYDGLGLGLGHHREPDRRDHRDDAKLSKSKGRFNLLLIELSLHNDCTDPKFVGQLLDEMARRDQPRSLLKALEHVVDYENRVIESPLSVANDSVKGAIFSVFHSVLTDLERMISNRQ